MEEFFGHLIIKLIPWLIPGFIFASFIVNYTGMWEKGSGDGDSSKSQKSTKGKKTSEKKEEKELPPAEPESPEE